MNTEIKPQFVWLKLFKEITNVGLVCQRWGFLDQCYTNDGKNSLRKDLDELNPQREYPLKFLNTRANAELESLIFEMYAARNIDTLGLQTVLI